MTEATQTIVERPTVDAWAMVATEGASLKREQLHREIGALKDPTERANLGHTFSKLFMFLQEDLERVIRRRHSDKAEIERLQARVKELEEAHRKIATTSHCGYAITSGMTEAEIIELVSTFWNEFSRCVSISSAVLQSSGGKNA